MTDRLADHSQQVGLLREHLAAGSTNRSDLVRDPNRMAAIAADIAPTDPALRNALRAIASVGAGRLFLSPTHPGPGATEVDP